MTCAACDRSGVVVQDLDALCVGCRRFAVLIDLRAESNGGELLPDDARWIIGIESGTVAAISRIGRGCINAKWPAVDLSAAGRMFQGLERVALGPRVPRRGRK
ncbi:MAG: hypothetical protein EBU52_15975 [Cytophagia bacterium]|nr:hypothetical protein [Cytophagia bacterium]